MAVSIPRVLVVDDEPGIRYFLEETLADDGYQVITAASGERALDLISSEEFDIALLDLKMGEIGGLEVLSKLRQHSPDTIAIVLTAHGSMNTAIEALRQGAHDYLLKPCDPEHLLESVRSGLDKHQERRQQLAGLKYISDASHQLRSPITSISLHLDLLARSEAEKHAFHLDVLRQETDQMEELVNRILTLSRLESGQVRLEFGPQNLNALAESVVAAHQIQAEAIGSELVFEPAADLPLVRAAHNQLAQVVINLVTNALNHTPAGRVRVSTYLDTESGQACLQVQDTGIGIEPDDLLHLFERFYRGARSIEAGIPGTGLGLAIVKEIVDLHGGRIEVESQVDEGSTFRVWLPVDQSNHKGGKENAHSIGG